MQSFHCSTRRLLLPCNYKGHNPNIKDTVFKSSQQCRSISNAAIELLKGEKQIVVEDRTKNLKLYTPSGRRRPRPLKKTLEIKESLKDVIIRDYRDIPTHWLQPGGKTRIWEVEQFENDAGMF